MNFGPVVVEPHEPVFHARWEAAAMVLVSVVTPPGGTLSSFRHTVERMDPAHYLGSPYYEHWLTAAATMAVESGVVSHEELEKRAGGAFPLARPVRTGPLDDIGTGATRFAVGDEVRVLDRHPLGHTRCPDYLRSRVGTVLRRHGVFRLPDLEAHGRSGPREGVYTIRFGAREVWGDGQAQTGINADLWDSYLEPA
jgi:nitrile hydratase